MLQDPSYYRLDEEIGKWLARAKTNKRLKNPKKQCFIVYYSGHGIQDPKGKLRVVMERPYFFCIDNMLSAISAFATSYVIVLYDCCRTSIQLSFF